METGINEHEGAVRAGAAAEPPPVARAPAPPDAVKPRFGAAALGSFAPRVMAPFARRNYRHEIVAVSFWPIAVTMIESAVTGTIAQKAFDSPPGWVIAVLAGASAYSNITSSIWARLVDGEKTVRNLVRLQLGVLIMVAVIAVCPVTDAGLYVFAGAAVMARMLMAGVVTLRSVLWRSNYLRSERARVTGKLMTIQTIIISLMSLSLGFLLDLNPQSFRFVYPLALLAGLAGVMRFARIRVRHPFQLIDHRRAVHPRGRRRGMRIAADWARTIGDMIRILKEDAAFRGFMLCMFVMGMSNLAITAPVIRMLDEQFEIGYLGGLTLIESIPLAMAPLAIPLWARLLDCTHIIRFRMIHSWVFVTMHMLLFLGAWWNLIGVIALAQLVQGVGMAGGALAWNIGHNDFASRREAGLYMSVHVTLTGVRGVIGSICGMLLFTGRFGPIRGPELGEYSFLFWGALGAFGAVGFAYLNRKYADVTGRRPVND